MSPPEDNYTQTCPLLSRTNPKCLDLRLPQHDITSAQKPPFFKKISAVFGHSDPDLSSVIVHFDFFYV